MGFQIYKKKPKQTIKDMKAAEAEREFEDEFDDDEYGPGYGPGF